METLSCALKFRIWRECSRLMRSSRDRANRCRDRSQNQKWIRRKPSNQTAWRFSKQSPLGVDLLKVNRRSSIRRQPYGPHFTFDRRRDSGQVLSGALRLGGGELLHPRSLARRSLARQVGRRDGSNRGSERGSV